MDSLLLYRRTISQNGHACSRHFVSGRPADLCDNTNPDWPPTLNLGHGKRETGSARQLWKDRRGRRQEQLVGGGATVLWTGTSFESVLTDNAVVEVSPWSVEEGQTANRVVEVTKQTELMSGAIANFEGELNRYLHTVDDLAISCRQRMLALSEESLQTGEYVTFHMGLPNFKTLKAVFDHYVQSMPCSESTKLTPFQEFIAVMWELRLNCQVHDLAYRLGGSQATVSQILLKWLTEMIDYEGYLYGQIVQLCKRPCQSTYKPVL